MLSRLRDALACGVVLLLSACEVPPKAPELTLTRVAFAALPGWPDAAPGEALAAWRRSCARIRALADDAPLGGRIAAGTAADWRPLCAALERLSGDGLRRFVEANFTPFAVRGAAGAEGLFTGYFEPVIRAAERRGGGYRVPIRGLPSDLVTVDLADFDPALAGRRLVGRVEDGRLRPYPARGAIEDGAAADNVLYWADDALDVFIVQVQGSGVVVLPDGRRRRIGFAGHNGHDYASVGRWLLEAGKLPDGDASWRAIRAWLERHPDEAADVLARNPRYIFFREIAGDAPRGAAGVALTPGRSLAVDPDYLPLNVPLWLDTVHPDRAKGRLQRLMLAQDVGNAIRGPVRGDFFWGEGRAALALAGRMKSPGRYYLLLPNAVVPPRR